MLRSLPVSRQRSLKYWELLNSWWQISCNSNFHLKPWILSLGINIVSFLESKRLTLFLFKKMSPKYEVWLAIVCHLSFPVKILWKKALVQLTTQLRKVLYIYFPFLHIDCYTQGLRFNKVNSFKCFMKGVLRWNW